MCTVVTRRYSFPALDFPLTPGRFSREHCGSHASEHEVMAIEDSLFGRRYIVDGELSAADGRKPRVRVIWFTETGEDTPHLVTAYPLEKT
jgi:hypothetical protein